MNNRYHITVFKNNIEVIDTKLFRADSPNGICVTFIGCGNNKAKLEANLTRVIAEYDVAPQNVKYIKGF